MTLYPQAADVRERGATHTDSTDLMTTLIEARFFGGVVQTQTATASTTSTGLLTMIVQRAAVASSTATATLARRVNATRAATTMSTTTLTRAVALHPTAATTSTGALGRAAALNLTGSTSSAGLLARAVRVTLVAATTTAGLLARTVTKALTAATTTTVTLTRLLGIRRTATTASIGSLSTTVIPIGPAVIIVLTVGPPGVKWVIADPVAGKLDIGAPTERWRVGVPTVQQYASTSREYVPVPVSAMVAGVPYDPTGDTVQMAFVAGFGEPASGDWKAAVWDSAGGGRYFAQCLIGPGGTVVLAPGVWNVWVKITDSPEVPVRLSGQIEILP